jgi:hypothetical protein
MSRLVTVWGAIALVVATSSEAAAQITLGQVDTFQSGTALGWQQGLGANGLSIQNGGPGGAGDLYMQVVGTGDPGAGGRITAFNNAQWTGNYAAAGVTVIEMDLWAPTTNTQNLSFRIALKTGPGMTAGYLSPAFTVPDDGVWRHAVFQLSAVEMIAVGAPSPYETFIQSVGELRVLHSTTVSLNGQAIDGGVGIDNIRASGAPVPEPVGLVSVTSVALAGSAWFLRRRRSSS